MPTDGKKPILSTPERYNAPARPVAKRRPGETARPDNGVKASDPFGAPRLDTEWTREAITTKTVRPSFGGTADPVSREHVKNVKG